MKRQYIFFSLAIISSTISAQSLKISQVPAVVNQAFISKYPDANGKWERENGNYEVNFKWTGKQMSCLIDSAGNLFETETSIQITELPTTALSYIKTRYPGVKIREAATILKNNGETIYEAQIDNTDLLFDIHGNFIKKIKE